MLLQIARVDYQIIRKHAHDPGQDDRGPAQSKLVAGANIERIEASLRKELSGISDKIEILGMEVVKRDVLFHEAA